MTPAGDSRQITHFPPDGMAVGIQEDIPCGNRRLLCFHFALLHCSGSLPAAVAAVVPTTSRRLRRQQLRQRYQARGSRQHPVENYKIWLIFFEHDLDIVAMIDKLDFKPSGIQIVLNKLG